MVHLLIGSAGLGSVRLSKVHGIHHNASHYAEKLHVSREYPLLIGVVKGYVLDRPRWRSGLETLLVGGGAAGLAYLVGVWLRGIAGT